MGAKVVDFESEKVLRSPHVEGLARCLNCSYEWQAVAPTGTHELECRSCGSFKGYFVGSIQFEDAVEYVCDCDNNIYKIGSQNQVVCAKCGITHGHVTFLDEE